MGLRGAAMSSQVWGGSMTGFRAGEGTAVGFVLLIDVG